MGQDTQQQHKECAATTGTSALNLLVTHQGYEQIKQAQPDCKSHACPYHHILGVLGMQLTTIEPAGHSSCIEALREHKCSISLSTLIAALYVMSLGMTHTAQRHQHDALADALAEHYVLMHCTLPDNLLQASSSKHHDTSCLQGCPQQSQLALMISANA